MGVHTICGGGGASKHSDMSSFGRQGTAVRVDGGERGGGGPHLVKTGSLSEVLLASFELHLRRLGQTFLTQDAVDDGLRDAKAAV